MECSRSMPPSRCASPPTSPTSTRCAASRGRLAARIWKPEVNDREVTLGYRGLDGVVRSTLLQFTPRPQSLSGDRATFEIGLAPKQAALLYVTVGCEREPARPRILVFDRARADARAQLDSQVAQFCAIETGNGQFDALVKRATSDLHMMTTVLPTGLYPYAGVPWFNTPFRPRRHHHRAGVPLAESESGPGRLALPGIDAGRRRDSGAGRRARQDPARNPQGRNGGPGGDALCALLRQRGRHASVRRAGRRLLRADRRPPVDRGHLAEHRGRPAVDRPLRRPRRRRVRRIRPPLRRRPVAPGLEGFRRRHLSRGRHARAADRSPCARCRATCTRRGGLARRWQRRSRGRSRPRSTPPGPMR